ncbi:MAG: prepilin-type N-terminal cleavage/methylation domain-containing protein [Lachnospiraceae bacterium]|nr:prepilin-type N-terminal cleavage/methylation domain-containing protein [Lachnospiraceae bacterium]
MNDRGETLVEMVVSLALLALTVTMVVMVFTSSSNTMAQSIETRRLIDEQVDDVLRGTDVSVVESVVITWTNGAQTETAEVELIKSDKGGLAAYRYR